MLWFFLGWYLKDNGYRTLGIAMMGWAVGHMIGHMIGSILMRIF